MKWYVSESLLEQFKTPKKYPEGVIGERQIVQLPKRTSTNNGRQLAYILIEVLSENLYYLMSSTLHISNISSFAFLKVYIW